jgi:FAD:protein FMN transferase
MNSSTDLVVVEQSRRIMATRMSIHVAVPPKEVGSANATIARAMAWLESLSDRLTRFSMESELSRLNASAGTWCAVSGTLFSVVVESLEAASATDGLFDPALLPLLEALGYDRDFDEIEHRETGPVRTLPDAVGTWRAIQLDARRLRILLPPGTRLDLGGIAKGWAADAVLARFLAKCDNALVNAGGDMRARGGKAPDEPWAIGIGIGIGDSRAAAGDAPVETAPVLTMGRGGIATSGAQERWWYQNDQRQHHILDPRTCRPVPLWIGNDSAPELSHLIATATALAPTAAHAEVAAKVALLRGYPDALRAVERAWDVNRAAEATPYTDESVALLLVLGNGSIVHSTNIQAFLTHVGGGGDLWLD